MKDCWKILGIQPTRDTGVIRKNYLGLIKKYHPDTVFTPEQKRKYTIRCAEINVAYEETIRQAELIGATPSGASTEIITAQTQQSWYSRFAHYCAIIVGLIGSFVIIGYLMFFVPRYVMSLSETNIIRVIFSSLLVFVISTFVGFLFLGTFDFLIAALFPYKLVVKVGLEKYEKKMIWFLVLIFNLCIMYFTILGNTISVDNAQISQLYATIWRLCSACAVPFIMALDWIKDIIKYARVKKRGFNIQIIEHKIIRSLNDK